MVDAITNTALLWVIQRVLESIFISVVASLHAEMEVLAHSVMDLLSHLEEDIDQTRLKELLQYTKKVGRFESKTLLIRDVFEELLDTGKFSSSLSFGRANNRCMDPVQDVFANH